MLIVLRSYQLCRMGILARLFWCESHVGQECPTYTTLPADGAAGVPYTCRSADRIFPFATPCDCSLFPGGEGQGAGTVILRFCSHSLFAPKAPSSGLRPPSPPRERRDGRRRQNHHRRANAQPLAFLPTANCQLPTILPPQTTTSAQSPASVRSPCPLPFAAPPQPAWPPKPPAPTRTDTP